MLASHDKNNKSRFRLAQSLFVIVWIEQKFNMQNCKAWSIESKAQLNENHRLENSTEISNVAQAHMTCRIKCFTSSIKEKT